MVLDKCCMVDGRRRSFVVYGLYCFEVGGIREGQKHLGLKGLSVRLC